MAKLSTTDVVDLIGLGGGIFLACTSAQLARDMTNYGISEISIDYIDVPPIGRYDAIFLTLNKNPQLQIDFDSKIAALDQGMNLKPSEDGQLVSVPKLVQPTKMALMALFKLRKFERIKIVGAGGAINPAVAVALMLTQGHLAKGQVGIEFVGITTVQGKEEGVKQTTGITIYLTRGQPTQYSPHHNEVLEEIKSGRTM